MIQVKEKKSIDVNDEYRDKPQILVAYDEVGEVDFLFTRDDGEECEQGRYAHTAITRLRKSGMRPKVLRLLTGHSSDGMIDYYDNPLDAELYRGLEKSISKKKFPNECGDFQAFGP